MRRLPAPTGPTSSSLLARRPWTHGSPVGALLLLVLVTLGACQPSTKPAPEEPQVSPPSWRAISDDCERLGGPIWRAMVVDRGRGERPPAACPMPDAAFQEAWLGKVVPVVHQTQMLECLQGADRSACEARHEAAQARDWSALDAPPEPGIYDYADARRRRMPDGCSHWQLRRLTVRLTAAQGRGGAPLHAEWEASTVLGAVCEQEEEAPGLHCRRVGRSPVLPARAAAQGYRIQPGGLLKKEALTVTPAAVWECAGIVATMPPGWRPPAALARLCERKALRVERELTSRQPPGCEVSAPFDELRKDGALVRPAPLGLLVLVGRAPYRLLRRQAAAHFND